MANIANVKVKVGNVLSLSGSSVEITGSEVRVGGDLKVNGTISASVMTISETIVSSSVIHHSGSTRFGDNASLDTHTFSGSVNIDGLVSSSVGFSGDGAGLTNLTGAASQFPNFQQDVRNQLSGAGAVSYDPNTGIISSSALTTAVTQVNAGNNIVVTSGSGPIVTVALTNSITGGLTTLTGLTDLSSSTGSFAVLSASAAEFSGNVLIYGTASLSSNPDAAYVRYTGLPEDKILIYPGLKVSGSTVISGNLDVTGSVSASSFTGSGANLTNLPAANLTGIVPLANGGTGLNIPSASITDGLLLIGNDSTNSFETGSIQVQGTGLHLTNSAGSIIISSSLGQGITQVTSSDPNLVIQSGSGPNVTASLAPNPTFGNLTVTSSLNVSASLQRTRRTVTGSVSVAATDQAIFVNPAAATVVTLPSPTALDGRELIVKRVDDPLTAFTVDVSGATIDDSGSFGLNGLMQSITLIADSGSNKWFVV
jgi:hypothetical protein